MPIDEKAFSAITKGLADVNASAVRGFIEAYETAKAKEQVQSGSELKLSMGEATPCGVLSREEDRQKTCPSPATFGEIRYNEAEKSVSDILERLLANEAIDCLSINIEQILMLLRPYLRTTKRESPDLAPIVREAWQFFNAEIDDAPLLRAHMANQIEDQEGA